MFIARLFYCKNVVKLPKNYYSCSWIVTASFGLKTNFRLETTVINGAPTVDLFNCFWWRLIVSFWRYGEMVLKLNLILHFQDKVLGMSMVLMVFSVGMVAFALIGDMAHLLCAFVFKIVAVPCTPRQNRFK